MAKHLTKEQLLLIHEEVCKEYKEDLTILFESQLDLIIDAPSRSVFDFTPYTTLNDKAGALMHEGLKLHPFLCGNKRTALLATKTFLEQNGRILKVEDPDQKEVCLRTTQCSLGIKDLSTWIEVNTVSRP